MSRTDRLFSEFDISGVRQNIPAQLIKAIEELDDTELFDEDEAALVERLVERFAITVPTLSVDSIETSQREVDVDLSQDNGERFMRDLDRPYLVKATEVSFRVPYQGTRDVFRCRPSVWTMTAIYAEVDQDALLIRVVRRDQNAAQFRAPFDSTIKLIEDSLAQLRSDCNGLESSLRSTAVNHVAKRKEKRQQDRGLLDQLGFKKSAQ